MDAWQLHNFEPFLIERIRLELAVFLLLKLHLVFFPFANDGRLEFLLGPDQAVVVRFDKVFVRTEHAVLQQRRLLGIQQAWPLEVDSLKHIGGRRLRMHVVRFLKQSVGLVLNMHQRVLAHVEGVVQDFWNLERVHLAVVMVMSRLDLVLTNAHT